MKKLLIGGISAVSIAAGSVALAAVNPLDLAFARGQQQAPAQASGDQGAKRHRGESLDEALDSLVQDGTLTKEQAEKVKQRLLSNRRGAKSFLYAGFRLAADSIGIAPQDLARELAGGKSIADVAQAHGVDPQKVINDLVAAATTKIDEAVNSGRLSAERAAALKQRLPDEVSKFVNRKFDPSKHKGKRRGAGAHRPGVGGPAGGDNGAANPSSPANPAAPDEKAPPAAGGDQGGSTTTAPPAPSTAAPTTAPPTNAAGPSGGDAKGNDAKDNGSASTEAPASSQP